MLIKPKKGLNGQVKVPGDKSISHRSAIIASICGNKVSIDGFLQAKDCLSTLDVLRKLGVKIKFDDGQLIVEGKDIKNLEEPRDILYTGNSGTTIRLMSGLLTALNGMSILTGDESINNRPMKRIISPLREMGADIFGRDENKKAPIVVFGGKDLRGKKIISEFSSAQVKSSIILAALSARGKTVIEQPRISRDHTERLLKYFGIDIHYDGKVTEILPGQRFRPKDLKVPGDLSSAAYLIVAATVLKDSNIIIKDVGINPTRSYVLDVLKRMGANIEIKNRRFFGLEPVADIETKSSELSPTLIEEEKIPNIIDDIPILCVAASFAQGRTRISGAQELRVKESDRIEVMERQLKRLGVDIAATRDGLEISGSMDFVPKSGSIDSFGDHRIAMSFAVMAMASQDGLDIKDFDCADISFPGFKDIVERLS